MQTKFPLFLVMALAAATLIWTLSGVGGIWGVNDPIGGDSQASDKLEDQANDSAASEDGNFDSSAQGSDDGNIVGLVISGVDFIVTFGSMVALLPLELEKIGVPRYLSYPIGLLAQALVGLGIVQFASNRIYE